MTYYEWKKKLVNNYQKERLKDMHQFGIEAIDDNNELGKKLISINVFGTNDNKLLQYIMNSNNSKAIIIGFGSNNNLHLGHLLLVNELIFYLKNLKRVKLYFVNLEFNNDKSFVDKIIQMIKKYTINVNYEIIDYKNLEVLKLKKIIAESLNINIVNRVMGWKNEKLQLYENLLDMLTTFSLGSILKEKQSIVITDINQKTYYALYKQIVKKINNNSTCFIYHMLMPSLKSPLERMSIKNKKSLIYLDEDQEKIESKLKKSYSGTENKEMTCSILRIADLVLSNREMSCLIKRCINNNDGCKNCKEKCVNNISKEIIQRGVKS